MRPALALMLNIDPIPHLLNLFALPPHHVEQHDQAA
jgi:hypothetical protein